MMLAFYRGTRPGLAGLFNRAVRWWTNGPYSHCEFVLGKMQGGKYLCASASNLDAGVRFTTIDLDPARWDLIEIDPALNRKAVAWFETHRGEAYDIAGLFGFVLRRGDGSRQRWFCSEACAAALGLGEPWRFDPNTLAVVVKRLSGQLPGVTQSLTPASA